MSLEAKPQEPSPKFRGPVRSRTDEEMDASRQRLLNHPTVDFSKFLQALDKPIDWEEVAKWQRTERRRNNYRDEYDQLTPEELETNLALFRQGVILHVGLGEISYLKGVGIIMAEAAHRKIVRRPRKFIQRIADRIADDVDHVMEKSGVLLRRAQSPTKPSHSKKY